jgi:hypothetical protein
MAALMLAVFTMSVGFAMVLRVKAHEPGTRVAIRIGTKPPPK